MLDIFRLQICKSRKTYQFFSLTVKNMTRVLKKGEMKELEMATIIDRELMDVIKKTEETAILRTQGDTSTRLGNLKAFSATSQALQALTC